MIANAEICDAPVAGEQFTDVAAVAAVLAILDGLASKTLAALDTVDLPDAARAPAMAAPEDARNDVIPTALDLPLHERRRPREGCGAAVGS
jgi:hypothetical protein